MNRSKFYIGAAAVLALAALASHFSKSEGVSAPACSFDEADYLTLYPDVARAVAAHQFPSGYAHYLQFGQREGRLPSRACIAACAFNESASTCAFNESEYLQLNPDVARAVGRHEFTSGADHFARFGISEKRAPALGCPGMSTRDRTDLHFDACDFNETTYLALHPEVAAEVRNGRLPSGAAHYLEVGQRQYRKPSADCPREDIQR